MSPLQKFAWWNLAVCGLILVCFLVALPFVGPRVASASFALGVLWAFDAYLLRTRRDGKAAMDERDRQIWGFSLVAGYSVFWAVFVAACILPRHIYGRDGSMPVHVLTIYIPVAWAIILFTQSIVILIQYRRGAPYAGE